MPELCAHFVLDWPGSAYDSSARRSVMDMVRWANGARGPGGVPGPEYLGRWRVFDLQLGKSVGSGWRDGRFA